VTDPFSPDAPAMFVSTHLDDVALSCGHALAAQHDAIVLTFFADGPSDVTQGWNTRTTGAPDAAAAFRVRRGEDVAALESLGAHAVHLDAWEAEFVGTQDVDGLATRVADEVRNRAPHSLVTPLGLHHADHLALADACLRVAATSELPWYVYLDQPYAHTYPGEVDDRLSAVRDHVGLVPLAPVTGSPRRKRRAVRRYASQLAGLRSAHPRLRAALRAPERYWRVTRPAAPAAERSADRTHSRR
jgi:LmbE family N-acetylglucosaminyl deacetylase